jgi:3-phosphoshikimate 1-carboxyvinyltransferase
VHGVGLRGLRAPEGVLDCGNSGTAMRLLCGVMAGQAFDSVLTGDASLSKRPMRRVTGPLASMGAVIETTEAGTPPLRVRGGRALRGVDHASSIASAQVKSAVLLAGLYADGETVVTEPRPTRDYTERMLRAFGWPVAFEPGRARLSGGRARGFFLGGILHRGREHRAGFGAGLAQRRHESASDGPAARVARDGRKHHGTRRA